MGGFYSLDYCTKISKGTQFDLFFFKEVLIYFIFSTLHDLRQKGSMMKQDQLYNDHKNQSLSIYM